MWVVLLILSGAHGLAVAPGLMAWVLALAWWGDARRRRAIVAIGAACAALGAAYMAGYERVPYHPTSDGPVATVKTAVQVLTMAWGPAVRGVWPVSGLLTCAALAGAALLCLSAAVREHKERVRATGYLCFLGAMATLALAIGLGRSGFESRYITLSVPVICGLYFVAMKYLPTRWRARGAAGLLGAALLAAPANTASGLEYARWLRGELGRFEARMRDGVPPHQLIRDHHAQLYPQQQLLADYLPMLRDAGFGAFARLAPDPPFREIAKPEWRQTIRVEGAEEFAVLTLDDEVEAAGIRVRFSAENRRGVAPFFRIAWNDKSYAIFPTGDRANWERGSWTRIGQPATELTVWVGERVRGFRIYPDVEPCTLRLLDAAVLVR
jgi:hypothetical protein